EARLQLHQEAQGLESRIANSRRLLIELAQERERLQATLAQSVTGQRTPAAALEPRPEDRPTPMLSFGSQWQQRQQQLQAMERKLQSRLLTLRRLAGDLADQRLYLAEQYERLAHAQQQWQKDRQA